MSILQICSHERLNVSGKQIQSLSLLGHWLKSCLFQQWPKLITIQACCSVTNSMWKELVASEAGAHCRQPQQKDQGFGWTLNTNFSSTPGITSCPNPISGMDGTCQTTQRGDLCCHMSSALQPGGWDSVSWHWAPAHLAQIPAHLLPSAPSQGLCWASLGKDVPVLVSAHPSVPQDVFHPGCSLTRGLKTNLWRARSSYSWISLCVSGDPQDKRDDFIYLWYKERICTPQIKTVWSLYEDLQLPQRSPGVFSVISRKNNLDYDTTCWTDPNPPFSPQMKKFVKKNPKTLICIIKLIIINYFLAQRVRFIISFSNLYVRFKYFIAYVS